ncbi:MAG: DUF4876 domain-containing protein [Dysgonamonadaceae bacterium]|jgi:hypothetical protein|nr:DUF4876 domain-containing protein [Dysgonamonadaceae bacterium]
MKKLKLFAVALFIAGGFGLTSCGDDAPAKSDVTLSLNANSIGDNFTVTSGKYVFTDVSTGLETVVDYASASMVTNLFDGLYNVTFIGEATYSYTVQVGTATETKTAEVTLQGSKTNIEVKGGTVNLALKVYPQEKNAKRDFVIAEIFAGGSYNTETAKQYNGDQYVRIYNNSDETLYADGLVLLESKFATTQKFDYKPDILDEAFAVQSVVRVPGNGTTYPVLPGKSIILCDNAINHTEALASAADLSKADFEWYTVGTSSNPDVDNPDVPNLEIVFNYTSTIWLLNKQGNRAYAIGRIPASVSAEKYVADYTYPYTYTTATGTEAKPATNSYKFPNEWIIDAVNLSPKTAYVWNITSGALDLSYTYIGETSSAASNATKAVVRKVASTTEEGREILQDTNNSAVDFTPSVKATLLN